MRLATFADHGTNLANIERARQVRAARTIIDDKDHPFHLQLMSILELEIALDLHDDSRDRAGR